MYNVFFCSTASSWNRVVYILLSIIGNIQRFLGGTDTFINNTYI